MSTFVYKFYTTRTEVGTAHLKAENLKEANKIMYDKELLLKAFVTGGIEVVERSWGDYETVLEFVKVMED